MSTYPGGKNGSGVYQRIINMMPPHAFYIEPFLGGGAILRHKRPAPMANIGIDIDAAVIAAFRSSEQLAAATVICGDGLNFLIDTDLVFRPDTLVYCDPPYLMSTRSSKRPYYEHEFATEKEHKLLLLLLRSLTCMVMISGYASSLYDELLPDWRVEKFQTVNRAGKVVMEHVWCNFPVPMELHDYRWLGDTFRQRELIKRKQARWRKRLAGMDSQERYALLSVLEDLRPRASPDSASMASIDIFGDGCRRSSPNMTMGAPIAENSEATR